MLLDSFFKIASMNVSGDKAKAELVLDASHKIYDGHFPNLPIVPGVCMMQMLKETLEKLVSSKLRLKKADQMKFLIIIDPLVTFNLDMNILFSVNANDDVSVVADLVNDGKTYFKFKGSFVYN